MEGCHESHRRSGHHRHRRVLGLQEVCVSRPKYTVTQVLIAYLVLFLIMFAFTRFPAGYRLVYYLLVLTFVLLLLVNATNIRAALAPIAVPDATAIPDTGAPA